MRFGGLQKNSFIDYPKKISCVIFVNGCNFHCPFCHNPDLLSASDGILSRNDIIRFLEERTDFLDAVVISGGEPTLQIDLPGFCEKVKSMGYLLKVDTNGSQPSVIRQLVKNGLVDYLAMDIKTDPANYPPHIATNIAPETILESIQRVMTAGIEYEFRTTCVRPIIDADILLGIGKIVKNAKRYALQQFRNHQVLDPDFFKTHHHQYGMDEMRTFKNIMEKNVEECIIR